MVIPPDFHDKRARGAPAKILVLIDGSDSIVSSGALAAINGMVASPESRDDFASEARGGLPLSAQPIILFNPEGRTANFIIPGLVAVLLQMIAVIWPRLGGARARERDDGAADGGPRESARSHARQSRALPVLGIVEAALVLSVMRFAFSVAIRGSLLFLFAVVIVYISRAAFAGPLHIDLAKTQQEAQQQGANAVFAIDFPLGLPVPAERDALRHAGDWPDPPDHAHGGDHAGHRTSRRRSTRARPHLLALLAFAVVMITLSVRRMSRVST